MWCCRGCHAAGLTKVPIDGQPPSIVQDLEDMCRQYIKVRRQGQCCRRCWFQACTPTRLPQTWQGFTLPNAALAPSTAV